MSKFSASMLITLTLLTPSVRAADFSDATNELVRTVLKAQLSPLELSGAREPVRAAEWKIVAPVEGGDFDLPYDRCWVFQYDGAPLSERLVRDRTVVVMSEDLSKRVAYHIQVPVRLRSKSDGKEVALEVFDEGGMLEAAAPKDFYTRNALAKGTTPLANTDNNTNLYAVLISGGYDKYNNGVRFYFDIQDAYQVLHCNCNVPRENIYTFIASGNESAYEHYYSGKYYSLSYDLDNDGTKDVNAGAYRSTISNCFATLSGQLTASDRLIVVVTTHGGRKTYSDFSSWESCAYLWGDEVSDDEFRDWTADFKCPVAFALEQCFSGGFSDDLVSDPSRAIATAANHLESSLGESFYNYYLHAFFSAIASGEAVTFYDAAFAGYNGDNLIAHPQYVESTAHLGYGFRFDALTPPEEAYGSVHFSPGDGATCLTGDFDYREGDELEWMPDAFSTDGYHDDWQEMSGTNGVMEGVWIPFSTKSGSEISGICGTAAAMVPMNGSFNFTWTAPFSSTYTFKLDGSYASGKISVSTNSVKVAEKSASSEWPSVTFPAVEGVRYKIALSSSAMLTARLAWMIADRFVATDGDDANDGMSELTPLRTIQKAIDVAADGVTVHVAPGRYEPFSSGNKNITIESDEGAEVTFIDGGNTNRCADMRGSSSDTKYDLATQLIGFTLENGFAGGSEASGAGLCGGSAWRCVIRNCTASGSGTVRGAASYFGMLYDCLVYGNSASSSSGDVRGGACYGTDLNNCTVADNSASAPNGSVTGGGLYAYGKYRNGELYWTFGWACNSIVVGTTTSARYISGVNAYRYSGEAFVKTRSGGDPKFVDRANGNYRLSSDSPCIDAGYDDMAPTAIDFEGNDRVRGGGIDLGCYESEYTADDPEVPETDPKRGGVHYGLFVGINEFASASVSTLGGCVNDALGLRERCLKSGLWHEEDVSIYTNSFATESAVRSAISGYAAIARPGDTFVFAQSSHGGNCSDDQIRSFLCMHDFYIGDEDCDGSYFDSELAADLLTFDPGVKVIVIADACQSGGLFKTWELNGVAFSDFTLIGAVSQVEEAAESWNFATRVRSAIDDKVALANTASTARLLSGTHLYASTGTNIAFITAADYDQYSWDSGKGGAFTTAFTDGWSSGESDANSDGKLNFYELYDHAAAIAVGKQSYVTGRTEAQCDNAGLLASVLAGYIPGVWPEPGIDPTDTPEEQAAKVQDAMIGAGFPEETAKAVTNAADYAYLQNWANEKGYALGEVAASPVALISPALGADELLSDMTSNDLQVVEMTPSSSGTEWKMSLSITDYDAAKVNESLLKSAIGVVGANDLSASFTADDLELSVEKGAETVELTVRPPADEERYFMRAKVR